MNWIELIDGQGQLLARRPEDAVPCMIGSARDNAIVVDGEGILPYHARIDANQDGTLSVTALGEHPGLHRPGAPERQPTLLLTLSAPVAIGTATLRLASTATASGLATAPPATGDREPETVSGWRALIARRRVQWCMAALLVAGGATVAWFSLAQRNREVTSLSVGLFLLAMVALWAGIFALIGRLKHGHAKFGQHFVVAGAMTILSLLVSELSSWQEFLAPSAQVMGGLMILLTSITAGFALFAQLRVYGKEHRERHLRIAAVATATLLLFAAAATRYDKDWSNLVEFSAVLKPWPASWTPARGLDALGGGMERVEKELEEKAE